MSTVTTGVQNKIIHGDCLEVMPSIPDKSIDMILCDLPYGTTACKWDTIIPFEPLWAQYERIIKDNGAIVLTASQPFTSALVMSNLKLFKYDFVWDKKKLSGILNAKRRPLRKHEDILVFYKNYGTYNPQMEYNGKTTGISHHCVASESYRNTDTVTRYKDDGSRYPTSVISNIPGVIGNSNEKLAHPTQKPVALFEYLIKTYTNEGETVLDNCIGSGTTAIACINTRRNYIGIEKDKTYYDIAVKRIAEHERQLTIC
jgi:site-specific DNA-methyltransferase (adenine-specific)